jgi:acylphosphatase
MLIWNTVINREKLMQDPSPLHNKIRVHVFITGKVQGVGYRMSTWQAANDLGLSGWVRNLPDGQVEAVFEGSRDMVEEMINWCYQGSAAVVKDVVVESEAPEGMQGFEIKR